jgi:hypothetical protein
MIALTKRDMRYGEKMHFDQRERNATSGNCSPPSPTLPDSGEQLLEAWQREFSTTDPYSQEK